VCFYGGRAELWGAFYEALSRMGPDVPPGLDLATKTSADPARTAAAAVPELDRAISELATETDPTVIMRVGFAAGFADRRSECRQSVLRVVRAGQQTRAVGSVIQGLILLAYDDFWSGQWDEATELADEAVELCDTLGFPLFALSGRSLLAAVAAARGDYAEAEAAVDALMRWALPRGVGTVRHVSCHVRGLAALGRGEFDEAYRLASSISPPGTLASHVPMALWVMFDLVDAGVRTGHQAEAAAHVAALQAANVAAISSRTALLAGAAAAVAAADDHANHLFEQALAIPGADHWPFDLARVHLAYGERLRRLRATTDSRVHLGAALETFERLGARPWATRSGSELRATGQTKPRAGEYAWASLTPQEREIAMLAAAGLTNKQIAERLFVSHRTVGGHLHRLFPKLGVATRAALRDALVSLPSEQHQQTGT
jgi:DNA-binding CsgD family transcriptional regulator